jgi:hexosaminidase
MDNIIPIPVSVIPSGGSFSIRVDTKILVEPDGAEIRAIGRYLAGRLRPALGYDLAVAAKDTADSGNIVLSAKGADSSLGVEGYSLSVKKDRVVLAANTPAGLLYGVQTIRQMLPAKVESATVQPGPWTIAAGTIRDMPRFSWRGAMLDVARSFFTVAEVKRYIDLLAFYKFNRFHLHLADDQGWRIEIKSWPKLAVQGGDNAVQGGRKGFFTQAHYADIVAYAHDRYIMVVPEIDMPGHCNAALSCYPELNQNGVAPAPYSGIDVGFSSLATDKEMTYAFVNDVIREVAALTPGPYIHIGGDEVKKMSGDEYKRFFARVTKIVSSCGKQMVGWGEIAKTDSVAGSVVQHWTCGNSGDLAAMAVVKGARVVMSPANKAYLDMKYTKATALGQDWAGLVEVKDAYCWDPADFVAGVKETAILGVEAPVWSETLWSMGDLEFMVFPRLAGLAEIAWSPLNGRNWDEYSLRLASHGARWTVMGVNFYRSPQVPW